VDTIEEIGKYELGESPYKLIRNQYKAPVGVEIDIRWKFPILIGASTATGSEEKTVDKIIIRTPRISEISTDPGSLANVSFKQQVDGFFDIFVNKVIATDGTEIPANLWVRVREEMNLQVFKQLMGGLNELEVASTFFRGISVRRNQTIFAND